jgi:hypothetical protein
MGNHPQDTGTGTMISLGAGPSIPGGLVSIINCADWWAVIAPETNADVKPQRGYYSLRVMAWAIFEYPSAPDGVLTRSFVGLVPGFEGASIVSADHRFVCYAHTNDLFTNETAIMDMVRQKQAEMDGLV